MRRLLVAPLVAVAAIVWAAVPALTAAGLALDHPAWSAPGIDPPAGPLTSDGPSWWPPGHRYGWTGLSGEPVERIDPWGSPATGHAWTAGVAVATTLGTRWLWKAPRAR